ncbi:2'-5' RNA ligase family protein [Fictibacillus iocasae]|uniref:2'-5' RNA ligase family protein n=1 Tax=Fictibacillus iocasae TaxID=2715437 RepID=A0ABW2NSU9_9BACL
MMYAVELFFDEKLEHGIRMIWDGLKSERITPNMADIKGLRPHLTLGVYDAALPAEEFVDAFQTFAGGLRSFNVNFETISFFSSSSVVFTPPRMTKDLFTLHQNYYQALGSYNEHAHELYLPGRWVPHCTLAMELNNGQLVDTLRYCSEHFQAMNGRLTEICVEKMEVNDEGHVSERLFSVPLKGERE